MDFSIDDNPDHKYHYNLPVHNGSFDYITVFWLPDRAELTDFKTLGFYKDPSNPDQPGKLSIKAGETVTGIDIYADWSIINP